MASDTLPNDLITTKCRIAGPYMQVRMVMICLRSLIDVINNVISDVMSIPQPIVTFPHVHWSEKQDSPGYRNSHAATKTYEKSLFRYDKLPLTSFRIILSAGPISIIPQHTHRCQRHLHYFFFFSLFHFLNIRSVRVSVSKQNLQVIHIYKQKCQTEND